MDDLIRRNDTLNAVAQYCVGCESYNGIRCRGCQINDALSAIENCEEVDVEPVSYAKWVWNDNAMNWGIGAWVCSECRGRNENIHASKPGTTESLRTNPYIWAGRVTVPIVARKWNLISHKER